MQLCAAKDVDGIQVGALRCRERIRAGLQEAEPALRGRGAPAVDVAHECEYQLAAITQSRQRRHMQRRRRGAGADHERTQRRHRPETRGSHSRMKRCDASSSQGRP